MDIQVLKDDTDGAAKAKIPSYINYTWAKDKAHTPSNH